MVELLLSRSPETLQLATYGDHNGRCGRLLPFACTLLINQIHVPSLASKQPNSNLGQGAVVKSVVSMRPFSSSLEQPFLKIPFRQPLLARKQQREYLGSNY